MSACFARCLFGSRAGWMLAAPGLQAPAVTACAAAPVLHVLRSSARMSTNRGPGCHTSTGLACLDIQARVGRPCGCAPALRRSVRCRSPGQEERGDGGGPAERAPPRHSRGRAHAQGAGDHPRGVPARGSDHGTWDWESLAGCPGCPGCPQMLARTRRTSALTTGAVCARARSGTAQAARDAALGWGSLGPGPSAQEAGPAAGRWVQGLQSAMS